ncbi:MAG: ABC transporter permease [Planctomycetia bacterium]|mgnify:FL=1|nr:ABC transporter permease [Planctomycetia bacterium]MBL6914824.1 ABC transporter permease [Planctomycetota bacterium]
MIASLQPHKSRWRQTRKTLPVLSLAWLTLVVLISILTPALPLEPIDSVDPEQAISAPSIHHWFGTDVLGRDLFSRILRGSRISLACALAGAATALLVGVAWGLIAGGGSRQRDNVMMRFVDLVDSIPLVFLVILVASVVRGSVIEESGGGLGVFFVILGFVYWTPMARVVRGETISLANREWALAATALGSSPQRILRKEILPNLVPTILVTLTLIIPRVLLFEAFLSFLGLGVQSPHVSWGTLARDAFEVLNPVNTAWWLVLYPSLVLAMSLLALNIIGDALRSDLDPKDATK